MKRNSMFNRMISFGIALALFFSSPASVFVVDASDMASVENNVENTSEDTAVATEGESVSDGEATVTQDEISESGDADDASQTTSDESTSEEKDSKAEEKLNKEETEKSASSEKASKEQKTEVKEEKTEEEKAKENKELTEKESEEEISYSYKSNGDGTHVKSWTDEDGEEHEEIEDCDYDENGKCKICGYEVDDEITLPVFEDGDVVITVTAKKSVLNGATKVKGEKILEGDEYDEIESALNDNASDNGKNLMAFLAYDITLLDDEDNEVEPLDGSVSVKITSLKAPETDENLDGSYLGLVHFEENEDSKELVDLTEKESTKLDIGDDASMVDVEFETDSFSAYAVTWSSPALSEENKVGEIEWRNGNGKKTRLARLYLVDENGNQIISFEGTISANSIEFGKWLDQLGIKPVDFDYFATIAADNLAVNGYIYVGAYTEDGTQVGNITKQGSSDYWYYRSPVKASRAKVLSPSKDINIFLTYKKVTPSFTVDLFQYNDADYPEDNLSTINYSAKVNAVENKYLEMNTGAGTDPWNACHYDGVYQGLADFNLDSSGMIKFSEYGTPDYFKTGNYSSSRTDFYTDIDNQEYSHSWGTYQYWNKKAYYNVSFPFDYENGYYVFDSDKKSATYSSGEVAIGDANGGFWPFGTGDDHFGMHFTTDFYMTSDGKYEGDDCVFEFSGDDDVWVYIDGKLVLDLGGIHDAREGSINFADGTVWVDKIYKDSGYGTSFNLYEKIFSESAIKNNGIHTLQVYYLERGSTASNCKIKFNLPIVDSTGSPIDVEFTKKDIETKSTLAGATFALYDSSSNIVGTNVTSGDDGVVKFESVPVGTYTLKELVTPTGFSDAGHYWTVNVYSLAGVTGYEIIDDTESGDLTYVNGLGYVIYNKPTDSTIIDYSKTAEVSDWENREYAITLTANGYTKTFQDVTKVKDSDLVLVLDATYSMYFPADLEKADVNKLDEDSEYYFITADKSATNYRVYRDKDNSVWRFADASIHTDEYGKTGSGNSGTVKEYVDANGNYSYKYVFDGKTSETNISTFYYSPSDGEDTRLQELQEQVTYLIQEMHDLCGSKSNIGIVYFNRNHGVISDVVQLTDENTDKLLDKVNGARNVDGTLESKMNSTTNQAFGMEEAYNLLQGVSDNNDKYVLLVTDGCPTGPTASNVASDVETYQYSLKNNLGVTTLSVGIDIEQAADTSGANEVLRAAASKPEYVYTTTSDALETVFDGIIEIITNGKIVYEYKTGATVTDVVDKRFELITDGHDYGTSDITVNADGTTTIRWSGLTIENWEKTIYVRAKSDFMGGNIVATNTDASGLTVDGSFYKFKEPTVNVHLLDLDLEGDEVTILLNDTFSPNECKKALVKYFNNNVLFNISDSDLNTLLANNVLTVPYSYSDTGDNIGAFIFSLSATDASPAGDTAIATEVGYHKYEYKLNVKYTAYDYSTRESMVLKNNSNRVAPVQKDIDAGYKLIATSDELYTKTKSVMASYFVNVVDAGVYISKIGGSTKSLLNGATYTLSLNPEFTNQIVTNVTSSTIDNQKGQMLFTGLGVGTYYLKETKAPEGYKLSDEVFTINIAKTEFDGLYSMTITSSTNQSEVPGQKLFQVTAPSSNDNLTVLVREVSLSVLDEILYTLPKTGGSGVYVYTIGGILLMIAGALLLYKNKNKKIK